MNSYSTSQYSCSIKKNLLKPPMVIKKTYSRSERLPSAQAGATPNEPPLAKSQHALTGATCQRYKAALKTAVFRQYQNFWRDN